MTRQAVRRPLLFCLLLLQACASAPTSDAGPGDSGGPSDAGRDAGPTDAGRDAGPTDAGLDSGAADSGLDATVPDAGFDAAIGDAGPPVVFDLVDGTDRNFGGDTRGGPTWDRPDSPDDTCPAASQPAIGRGVRYGTHLFRNDDSVVLLVAFDLESSYDPHLTVYTGIGLPSDRLACRAIDEDIMAPTNRNASVLFTMMPGDTVIVVASGHAVTDAGLYNLRAQAVPL